MPEFDRNDTFTATVFLSDGRQERDAVLQLGESFTARAGLPHPLKYKGEGLVGILGMPSELDAHIWQSTGNLSTLIVASDRVLLLLDALAVRELKNQDTQPDEFGKIASVLAAAETSLGQEVRRLAFATQRAGAASNPGAVRDWLIRNCCSGTPDSLADSAKNVDDVTVRINERTKVTLATREVTLNSVQSLGMEWQLKAPATEEFLLKWSLDVNTAPQPINSDSYSEIECRAFFEHAAAVTARVREKVRPLEAL